MNLRKELCFCVRIGCRVAIAGQPEVVSVILSSSYEFLLFMYSLFIEDVPCRHMLKVLDHTRKVVSFDELIGDIHLEENFKLAFLHCRI